MGFPAAGAARYVKPLFFTVFYIIQRPGFCRCGELIRRLIGLECAVPDQILQPGAAKQAQTFALCHTFALPGEQASGLVHPVNHALVVADGAVYAVFFVERSGEGVIDGILGINAQNCRSPP